ncbi:glycosyl transferase group 1 [Methanothermus fervidus DSM 2088]|uniref:Glycosyl transferase group 1 n=1 Tax=Methanothermus fervidus (strain ATCC 43054 / DSM 2088 / JCM 10308 / V24 S) TaxID=523846 RepID=E3GWA4_METFV|nr:glycosyltransferase [Methanothermus fervidus]ADP77869.1 glycosyl transferase group 1 [Methanothermus fervidus DSM 2088]
MKVCYFGSYPEYYPRHRIIKKGLEKHGVEVCEVVDRSHILLRYPKLALKYFKEKNFDVILVGEASNFVQPLALLLKKITNKPLIFDTYVSVYDTNKDRGIYKNINKIFYFLDKINCQFSDIVLQDTKQNLQYFHETFSIPKEKFRVVYIGAEEDVFYPRDCCEDRFNVLFYGTYIPLHGVEYIVKAAKLLPNVKFTLIGRGQTYPKVRRLSKNLNNVIFKDKVPYFQLPKYIERASVCLGIFGGTDKAMRVIPTKIYQSIAMRKPVITGDSPAIKELFEDKKNILLCKMADENSLAEAIELLKEDEKLRNKLSKNSYKLFKKNLTSYHIGKKIKKIIKEVRF